MKTLLLLIALLPATSWAGSFLNCGGGLRQQGWLQSDWLQDDGDHFGFVECSVVTAPPEQQGWFLTLPDIRWQQGLATDVSRSRGALEAQDTYLYWPMLRQQEVLFGLVAGSNNARQLHTTAQPLRLSGSIPFLAAGQEILLRQEEYFAGLAIDTRFSNTVITRTSLTYHYRRHPLLVQTPAEVVPASADLLSTARTGIWALRTEHEALRYGWQWHWSLALLYGEIGDLEQQPLRELQENRFTGLQLQLGILWRKRLNQNLSTVVNLSGGGEFWYLPDDNSNSPALESPQRTDYQISAGLNWRL